MRRGPSQGHPSYPHPSYPSSPHPYPFSTPRLWGGTFRRRMLYLAPTCRFPSPPLSSQHSPPSSERPPPSQQPPSRPRASHDPPSASRVVSSSHASASRAGSCNPPSASCDPSPAYRGPPSAPPCEARATHRPRLRGNASAASMRPPYHPEIPSQPSLLRSGSHFSVPSAASSAPSYRDRSRRHSRRARRTALPSPESRSALQPLRAETCSQAPQAHR
mmetsp:Transcript_44999/g.107947  ORF Transcript_44999/g.107947 Transcript_44999/m.107947 type:complete len:218 (-) Transcript_44999:54-707(-)